MKRTIRSHYKMLLTILLVMVFLESLLLLATIGRARDLATLSGNLQTIIIIFIFVIFVYVVMIFNSIPSRLRKSLLAIRNVIKEISHGNYQFEIKPELYDGDKNIQDLLEDLQKMLVILLKFDQSKADKIYEHHQRILLLINLLPQGALITLANGEIKYCNDALRRLHPELTEDANINELLFKDSFDQKVFAKISEALRYGNNLYDHKIPDANYQRVARINGSIVRNRKGVSTGGVFIMDFDGQPAQN